MNQYTLVIENIADNGELLQQVHVRLQQVVECKQLNVSIMLFIASVIVIFSILKIAKCNTKTMLPRHI